MFAVYKRQADESSNGNSSIATPIGYYNGQTSRPAPLTQNEPMQININQVSLQVGVKSPKTFNPANYGLYAYR